MSGIPELDSPAPAAVEAKTGPGRWWLVAALCALLGVGAGLLVSRAVLATPSKNIGTAAAGVFQPQHGAAAGFALANVVQGGATLSLAAYRGHPLIVNFWASWCPPCRKEMPALQAIARRYAGRIDFVGIDTNDQRASARAFLVKTGVSYPVGFDPSAAVAARYGVFGLPTTYFIGANGALLGREIGGFTGPKLLALIHQLYPKLR